MSLSDRLAQASLAATTVAVVAASYVGLTSPNPNKQDAPTTGDSIRWLFTHKHFSKAAMSPLGFLALHSSALAYFYPNIPSSLLRYGGVNGLNPKLITWSPSTAIPLGLILCAGVPLRLISYASLGKNFTFALSKPDHLKTDGVYRYVQHPSYTGLLIIAISQVSLLCRLDGVLSCWIPPRLHRALQSVEWILFPIGMAVLSFGLWTRVSDEERMLRSEFGEEWEAWHSKTWRFIPWIL